MTETRTPLDLVYSELEQSDAGRLRFFATFVDTELFVLLEREAAGDTIEPRLFPVEGQNVVLAFDTEARLAEFTSDVAAYVALPGRIVAQLLAPAGLGLGLNLGVAPSSTLLPPEAMDWVAGTLAADGPGEIEARIEEVFAPKGLPEVLLDALAGKLAQSGGMAQAGLLAEVRYGGGTRGHILALIGAEARAEPALVRAVNEALTFSALDAGVLDVAFFGADDEIVARLAKVALRFDIPQPAPQEIRLPSAPGSDPDKPPRLH